MKLVYSGVVRSTAIGQAYKEHASVESMDAYLADWQAAYEQLGRKIRALQALRDHRAQQVLNSEWPTRTTTTKDPR